MINEKIKWKNCKRSNSSYQLTSKIFYSSGLKYNIFAAYLLDTLKKFCFKTWKDRLILKVKSYFLIKSKLKGI